MILLLWLFSLLQNTVVQNENLQVDALNLFNYYYHDGLWSSNSSLNMIAHAETPQDAAGGRSESNH